MSLDILRKLVPPPARPIDPGSPEQWARAEADLGIRFPNDYKEYISVYGSGAIDDFIIVFNACSDNLYVNLRSRAKGIIEDYSHSRRTFPEDFNWPFFPEPEGWLPFGTTPNLTPMFWVTGGDPDLWEIVAAEGHQPLTIRYRETMTSFLEGILSRRLECEWLQGRCLAPLGCSRFLPDTKA